VEATPFHRLDHHFVATLIAFGLFLAALMALWR
jgi:hypothetical protein